MATRAARGRNDDRRRPVSGWVGWVGWRVWCVSRRVCLRWGRSIRSIWEAAKRPIGTASVDPATTPKISAARRHAAAAAPRPFRPTKQRCPCRVFAAQLQVLALGARLFPPAIGAPWVALPPPSSVSVVVRRFSRIREREKATDPTPRPRVQNARLSARAVPSRLGFSVVGMWFQRARGFPEPAPREKDRSCPPTAFSSPQRPPRRATSPGPPISMKIRARTRAWIRSFGSGSPARGRS